MGTRSITVILDDDGREICVLYRHMDGYPTGHGADLKEFLSGFGVVRGIGSDMPEKCANGVECLAAQIVAHFKDGIGSFYLYPAGTRDIGEEYIYTIYLKEGKPKLRIQGGHPTAFGFPGTKQRSMPTLYEGAVEDFDPETVENDWRSKRRDAPLDALHDID